MPAVTLAAFVWVLKRNKLKLAAELTHPCAAKVRKDNDTSFSRSVETRIFGPSDNVLLRYRSVQTHPGLLQRLAV